MSTEKEYRTAELNRELAAERACEAQSLTDRKAARVDWRDCLTDHRNANLTL